VEERVIVSKPAAKSMKEIHRLGMNEQWGPAARMAQEALHEENLAGELRDRLNAISFRARQLECLKDLQTALGPKWKTPPDAGRLKQYLTEMLAETGDAALTTRAQKELCSKLLLEGYPEVAGELKPPPGIEGDGPPQLRDLRVCPIRGSVTNIVSVK
jgi:hypothetical protein